jgi:F-type H+-transporting ATPase subunit epsilon
MKLKILIPTQILLEKEVTKVVAEAENGSFGLLENHIDFTAPLVPGIFSYETGEGREFFVAVDEGVLVKNGSEILVSTRNAVQGEDLGTLRQTVEEKFRTLNEMEKKTRSAVARIEADFIRGFMEFGR